MIKLIVKIQTVNNKTTMALDHEIGSKFDEHEMSMLYVLLVKITRAIAQLGLAQKEDPDFQDIDHMGLENTLKKLDKQVIQWVADKKKKKI